MKEEDKKLIWKLLDSEATEAEQQQAAKRQSEEPDFALEVAMRKQLHQSLQQQEAEQPSMRFAANVLDRLPQLYQRTIKPLIKPIWVKGFLYTMSALVLAYIGAATYAVATTDTINPEVAPGAEIISSFFSAFSTQTWIMVGMLGFSYLFFVSLDKLLKKRFADKQRSKGKPQHQ